MAGLRTLLEYSAGATAPTNGTMATLRIYNTNTNTVNNGGQCCLWTVPTGVTWIAVELWSGGGSGAGSCCNRSNKPGGAGSYGRKVFEVTPGDQWTICAGGTTNCCTGCTGTQGYNSYICKASTCELRAYGGQPGCTICLGHCSYGNCQIRQCACGCVTGASMHICGMNGQAKWTYGNKCHFKNFAPGAPYGWTGGWWSRNGCVNESGHARQGNCQSIPGSSGMASNNGGTSTRYCGAKGGSGMVQIMYITEAS